MSLQAITDIIVTPQQLQELQISNTINDSPKTTSSVSFSEILSSMQSENTDETKPVTEDKISKVQEEKPVEKTDKTESSEKAEKTAETEKTDKKEENIEKKDSKEVGKEKVEVKSDEKKVSKESKDDKKSDSEKKLTDKDFARLNQLVEKENADTETVVEPTLVAETAKVVPQDQKIEVKNEEDLQIQSLQIESQTQNQIQIESSESLENEASEFNFSENKNEKSKTTLDKDGKITVQDLRTETSDEVKLEDNNSLKISEVKQTSENTAQITIDLNQNANENVLSLNSQSAAADGSNFQAMLNNQIQNNAPEFVKAGNIVLKDNNQGTIDLVLHPDDLGNVKIHLSLDGKTVSGQITVNSKEALQVFKDNAETLREAFIKSGFDGASFDVAFNNGGSSNQNFGFEQQNDGTNLLGKKVYGNSAEAVNVEMNAEYSNDENYSNYSVNIVA